MAAAEVKELTFIVARHRPDLVALLEREFRDEGVKVMLDRRQADLGPPGGRERRAPDTRRDLELLGWVLREVGAGS